MTESDDKAEEAVEAAILQQLIRLTLAMISQATSVAAACHREIARARADQRDMALRRQLIDQRKET